MKKLLLISMFLFGIMALNANAIIDCNLTFPQEDQYDNGVIRLNVSVSKGSPENLTNVSWTIGTNVFWNHTTNGSNTSAISADFTYTLIATDLNDSSFSVYATCYNHSDVNSTNKAENSSAINYTVDTVNPIVALDRPTDRSAVTPANQKITLEYTPTDLNFGNCTLYLNSVPDSKATSATTNPNVTTGSVNKWEKTYTADDSSEIWLVECTDLAGLKTNSSSRSYNVVYTGGEPLSVTVEGGVPTAQPQQIQPQTIAGQAQGIAEKVSDFADSTKQYAIIIILVVLALLGFWIYKIKQSK